MTQVKQGHTPSWNQCYPVWLRTYYKYTQNDVYSVQHMEHTLKLLAPVLETLWVDQPLRIIDMGVGDGRMAEVVSSRFSQPATIFGIDIQADAVSLARDRLGDNATLTQGDVFRTRMDRLYPQALPAHILLMAHVIYFSNTHQEKIKPYIKIPVVFKIYTLFNLLRASLLTIRPCVSRQTVGFFMHFSPISRYLKFTLKLCGMQSRIVSKYVYKVHYPRISAESWRLLEEGKIDSLGEVPPELAHVQDLQHLIEINLQSLLISLSHETRIKVLHLWRSKLERNHYCLKRKEHLVMVTRRNALPQLWEAFAGMRPALPTRTIVDCKSP